jgi:NAD(P)-dependent dehydrogenase (short-subunit alcohol dehydrogenase family)
MSRHRPVARREAGVGKESTLKTIVVTGAAQGVGLATASLLARSNQRVILMDLQSVDAQVERLRAEGAEAVGISGDISSEPFVERAVRQMHDDFGAMDGLVNNAGISLISPAEETSAEQWRRVLDVNLFGPFLLCKHLGRPMLERGRGSIVNVASVAGLAGVIHRSAYNASKHGLVGLTRTLAAEWGGRGVRVNAVCGVDQDGNGCGRPGQRRLFGRGHRQSRSHGAIRAGGRCGGGHRVPPGRGAERLHQRREPSGRRRMDGGRQLGVAAHRHPVVEA